MDTRDLLNIMRGSKTINNEERNIIQDDRYFLNKIRNRNNINEIVEKTLDIDQEREENKMIKYFSDLEVIIDFIELEVFESGVFWGGTIDGAIQFVYKVTDNEKNSGFEIYYLEDFDKDNPDNQEISKRIELYYEEFYKFWRDNYLQK